MDKVLDACRFQLVHAGRSTGNNEHSATIQSFESRNGIFRIFIIARTENTDKGFSVLKARVPLAELYRYSTTLSSLTSGAATFTMEFADYQPVPADVQTKLLAEYAAQEKEEE